MDDLDLGSTIKGFSPGQKVFGRYTLTRILGRGGMGVVWLARDDKLERDVALKFLPEVMMGDKLALSDLKRETRRSLDLTHSHIVRIYDFVEDGRTSAIAMEYIPGETLTNARVDRPGRCYDPADLANWVGQLCDALDYAHVKAKVVHRDLKPANLMIDAAGDLKVTDFGISVSIADSVSRVSKQAGTSGTPVYMSPQQMMGDKPAVTDDIYALGATLYDLLTGKPPFFTGNIMLQVQGKVPPPLAQRRAELGTPAGPIPEAWENTIAACLAKAAADRPQSAGEVAERLGLAPGRPGKPVAPAKPTPAATQPRPPAPPVSSSSSVRYSGAAESATTGKSTAWVGLAAALLLLGGAGWYFGLHRPEQMRQAEERRQAELKVLEEQRLTEERRQAGAAEQARLAAVRIPVTLRTHPAGAEVVINGQARGTSPLVGLALPLGRHRVLLRQPGYEEAEQSLDVTELGRSEWSFSLTRSRGKLLFAVQPAEAEYALHALDEAGRRLSPAPRYAGRIGSAPQEVETGRYEVVITPPGGITGLEHKETVTVRRGETITITANVRKVVIDQTPPTTSSLNRQLLEEAGGLSSSSASSKNPSTSTSASRSVARQGGFIGEAYAISELDTAPVARVKNPPSYPVEMQRAGISGEVTIEFIINSSGDVVYPYVVRSSQAAFEAAALAAVQKWKFRPGQQSGRAVNVRVRQVLTFNLNE